MKVLNHYQKKFREGNPLYFKSGKPKRKYMVCRDPQYIREVTRATGHYAFHWACAGLRCPFYSEGGCDDKGREWE